MAPPIMGRMAPLAAWTLRPVCPAATMRPSLPRLALLPGRLTLQFRTAMKGAVLRQLLQRQAELAEQDGEEAEEAYRAVGRQIAALS
jgi:hypothetical protein